MDWATCFTVDIEVHGDQCPDKGGYRQARYLAHGVHDVLWTDSLEDACQFIRQELLDEYNKEKEK